MIERTVIEETDVKAKSNKRKQFSREHSTEISMFFVLLAFCVLSAILSPFFLTNSNLANIGTALSYMGVIAAGLTVVMLMGGIDLSQMAAMAVSVMMIGILLQNGVNAWLAILVAISVGILSGILNGFIITQMRVIPMIATIGTQMIYRALAYITTGGKYMSFDNSVFQVIGYGKLFGIPVMLLITLLVFVIIGLMLKYIRFGREVYAIGSNASASYLSGIKINKVKMIAYTICGATSGIAGILWAAQLGTSIATAGAGNEMTPIAAVVIGGVALTGGQGKMLGVFFGVALLSVFSNLMSLLCVDAYYQELLNGIILIAAVYVDIMRNMAMAKSQK